MIRRTRQEPTKKIIIKLMKAWREIIKENGSWAITPDCYKEWYNRAGVTKKTFIHSVGTYDNFIQHSEELIRQEADDYFVWGSDIKEVSSGLYMLMRLCLVTGKNKAIRKRQEERKLMMEYVIYAFDLVYWQDLFYHLMPAVKNEYPYMEETLREEHLYNWAVICRRYFRMWADDGLDEKLIPEYRQVMMRYYRLIFGGGDQVEFDLRELRKKWAEIENDKV